jgi:HEAT repeat protein
MAWAALGLVGLLALWRAGRWLAWRRALARARGFARQLADEEGAEAAEEGLLAMKSVAAVEQALCELLGEAEPGARAARAVLDKHGAAARWSQELARGNLAAKRRAISLFAKLGDGLGRQQLIAALGDDHPAVAGAAAAALEAMEPSATIPDLARALGSARRRAAETAAALLSRGGPAAVEALLDQLEEGNPQARRLACEALGILGEGRSLGRLRALLAKDPETEVRAAAAEALGRLGEEEGFHSLREAVRGDPDWFVQARAVNSLAGAHAPGSVEFLLGLLREGELWDGSLPSEREEQIDRPLSVDTVLRPRERLRQAIHLGLRELGMAPEEVRELEGGLSAGGLPESAFPEEEREELRAICRLLASPEAGVRCQAMQRLAELAGHAATELLVGRLKDAQPEVRAEAARLLAAVGAEDALEPLTRSLKDPDPGVRRGAAEAINSLVAGEPRAPGRPERSRPEG